MRLRHITTSHWKIYAASTDRGNCPLLEFLTDLDNSLSGHRDAMLSLLDEVSKHTERPELWLPSKKCHTITNDKKIWQFTVGPLRVAWFYDKGKVIVCSHGFVKDQNTTKKSDQRQALSTREKYFEAQENNDILIEDDE